MRTSFLFTISLVMLSCNNNNNAGNNESNEPVRTTLGKKTTPADSIFNDITIVHLPYTDSTSFDDFKETIKLSPAVVEALQLNTLNSLNAAYYMRYKIPFSENFTTVAITYRKGDAELFTTLINYDKSYNIIDKIDIAYDEIAESVLKKTSKISADKIQVTQIYAMEETPDIQYHYYGVQQDGKFVPIK